MALITCPDCGKEISDQARDCPNCGHPFSAKKPVEVREKVGLLGRRGTGFGCINFGCLALIVLGLLISLAVWLGEHF